MLTLNQKLILDQKEEVLNINKPTRLRSIIFRLVIHSLNKIQELILCYNMIISIFNLRNQRYTKTQVTGFSNHKTSSQKHQSENNLKAVDQTMNMSLKNCQRLSQCQTRILAMTSLLDTLTIRMENHRLF